MLFPLLVLHRREQDEGMSRMIRLLLVLSLITSVSGCGLAYTIVKSEAKLDKLSQRMSRAAVADAIGRPQIVLRDHGGVTVWQYTMTTRQQWLYELSLCPVSILLGGCIFYPFTNSVAEDNREHPVHVILVKDELCAWGSPLALMEKRKSCGTAVLPMLADEGLGGYSANVNAVITGSGPINTDDIDRYESMAVLNFADAPEVPGSGTRVAAITTTLLLDLGISLVERTQLDEVFQEQTLQLQHAEDEKSVSIGRLGGAHAVVVGDVSEWQLLERDRTAQVSLSLRIIDVQSGRVLFGGAGHFRQPMTGTPEDLARLLVHRILSKFAIRAGLLGTGRIGVRWTLRERSGGSAYVVEEIQDGSPAQEAGLRPGDLVVACNGSSLGTVQTEREARKACRIDAGQILRLRVNRDGQPLVIQATAERRPDV